MITIKSAGHEAAVLLTGVHHFLQGAETIIKKIVTNPATQAAVEGISTLTLGPASADVERAIFAVAGELLALLDSANSVDHVQKLVDLGFDKSVIDEFHTVANGIKAVVKPA